MPIYSLLSKRWVTNLNVMSGCGSSPLSTYVSYQELQKPYFYRQDLQLCLSDVGASLPSESLSLQWGQEIQLDNASFHIHLPTLQAHQPHHFRMYQSWHQTNRQDAPMLADNLPLFLLI